MHFLIRLERKPEQVHCSLHSCTVSILPKEEVKLLTKQLCAGEVKIYVCIGYMHTYTHSQGYWCKNSKGNFITVISLQLALQSWKPKCSSSNGLLVWCFMTSFVIQFFLRYCLYLCFKLEDMWRRGDNLPIIGGRKNNFPAYFRTKQRQNIQRKRVLMIPYLSSLSHIFQ